MPFIYKKDFFGDQPPNELTARVGIRYIWLEKHQEFEQMRVPAGSRWKKIRDNVVVAFVSPSDLNTERQARIAADNTLQQNINTSTSGWVACDLSLQNQINALPHALSRTNDTNVTLTFTGDPATALLETVGMVLGWSGQLAISRGGTGLSSLGAALQLLRVNAGGTGLEYFTATYISGNQTITISGDASGSGTTAITLTLANVATAGTKGSASKSVTLTINAKGLVTSLADQDIAIAASQITSGTKTSAFISDFTTAVNALAPFAVGSASGTITRSSAASGGTQTVTTGFQPSIVLFSAADDADATLLSDGWDNGSTPSCTYSASVTLLATLLSTNTKSHGLSIRVSTAAGVGWSAAITSMSSTGYTLTWNKLGAGRNITVKWFAIK